ncbi:MAG: MBL fold metallo-hydrolase [Alphaproteobacteria bacterium]|nr:MBL fold metallo-hydrolase [Alphaproteobacteria bacterium]
MQVTFWGVRGSIPVPGPATSRYGGNTSCIEVQADGGPPLVLDCGTGARGLGRKLLEAHEKRVEILFTHFHMDHVFGFPFFGPVYAPSCQVGVTVPAGTSEEAEAKLGRYLNGTYHPVRLRDVQGNLSLQHVRVGHTFERGAFRIQTVRLNHPGGCCGYRIEAGGKVMLYLSDTAPLAGVGEGLLAGKTPPALEKRVLAAMEGADLVVMDTMFSFDEYLEKMTWGHSYPEYGVALCEAARVGKLALFHHSPDASDAQLDERAERWSAHEGDLDIFLAQEGVTVDLEG